MAGRPPKPVTPEMFAELVAEWRATLAGMPGGAPRHGWMQRTVTLKEAADLTGLAYNSLRTYRAQGRMPAETPEGGWQVGTLAKWRAQSRTQNPGHGSRWPAWDTYLPQLRKYVGGLDGRPVSVSAAAVELGVERTLARKLLRHIGALPHRVTDAEILDWMRPIAEHEGRRVGLRELLERLTADGMSMRRPRAARLYLAAGGRLIPEGPTADAELGPLESLRRDGLITQRQVARSYGVSDAQVWKARQPRTDGPPLIKPAKWENDRPLYDPATLTHRRDMVAGPVQKGHPLAAELALAA